MPRIARFKIAEIADLLRQLHYASQESRKRQMDAAERLITEIDPQRNYPADFIVYRVTGFRPDRAGQTVTLVGAALVGDLVNLVQELSRGLSLPAEADGRRAIAIDEVARRLNISTRSLHRYRRLGLVFHYVMWGGGHQKLACFEDALTRFMAQHEPRLARASSFSRIDGQAEQEILAAAAALRRDEHLTINEVAQRLGRQFHRGSDTIRALIRRRDRRSVSPIFDDAPPLRQREIDVIWRAWRFGVGAGLLSRRFRKTRPTIHRVINRRRGELLRSLQLTWMDLLKSAPSQTEQAMLAAPVVNQGLHPRVDDRDALSMVATVESLEPLNVADEQAALGAYSALKRRAAGAIASLADWPAAGPLDQIETDLRWAAAIKRRLVEANLSAAIEFVTRWFRRPLLQQRSELIVQVIDMIVQHVSRTVETVDPARGQNIARLSRLAIDKGLMQLSRDDRPAQAGRMQHAQELMLGRPLMNLCPWQAWLSLRADLPPLVDQLDAFQRRLLTLRYGLDGAPPQTTAIIAGTIGRKEQATARLLADAERRLLNIARKTAVIITVSMQ